MSGSEKSANDSSEHVTEAPIDSFWETGQYKVSNPLDSRVNTFYPTYATVPLIIENRRQDRKWRETIFRHVQVFTRTSCNRRTLLY